MKRSVAMIQMVLGAFYVMAGIYKLVGPAETLQKAMPDFSLISIHMIGLVETLAALCLVLPVITRRFLGFVMWGAAIIAAEGLWFSFYHFQREAFFPALMTLVLAACAAFVAWVRYKESKTQGKNQAPVL